MIGTTLKHILASLGFAESEDCGCGYHAAEMDENGREWVIENQQTVIGWLVTEAKNRGFLLYRYFPKKCVAGWEFLMRTGAWLLLKYALWKTRNNK